MNLLPAALTWAEWLCQPGEGSVFFMLNNLATPNALDHFYYQDWVDTAFALYQDTPLQGMLLQGPWLVQPKLSALPAIAGTLRRRALSDESWGWAYRSPSPWRAQITHWQQRHLVMLGDRQVVLRLMDTRILSRLLPALTVDDWSELLSPVAELMLDIPANHSQHTMPIAAKEHATAHYGGPSHRWQATYDRPFTLGPHLIAAWEASPAAINNQAFMLCCELWEQQGEAALVLDNPEGELLTQMQAWIRQHTEAGKGLSTLTTTAFLDSMRSSEQ